MSFETSFKLVPNASSRSKNPVPVFYITGRHPNGRRINESLRTRDRTEAEARFAVRKQAFLEAAAAGRPIDVGFKKVTDGPLDAREVRRVLSYDPYDGTFRWREKTGPRTIVGGRAGLHKKSGHVEIKLRSTYYGAHRIAWLWMTGQWPDGIVDHRDRNPHNNSWENLRVATASQNNANKAVQVNNVLGIKGVHRRTKRSGAIYYKAQIKAGGKVIYLGQFDNPEDASVAYKAACERYHGAFAPHLSGETSR